MSNIQRGTRGVVLDSETHDKKDPKIIECAYGYVDEDGRIIPSTIISHLFNPGGPISFGAMATHHILPEDLIGMPHPDTFVIPEDVGYIIGHNIRFDLGALGNPVGYKAIDTLALGRKAWPEMDAHTQTALFYMLHAHKGLSLAHARDFVRGAHSAGVDIQICSFIFDEIIRWSSPHRERLPQIVGSDSELPLLEAMHLLSEAASVPLVMTFGKHQGVPTHTVPADYKQWYKTKHDNPDPGVLLAMDRGGSTPEGQAVYKLTVDVFGVPGAAEAEKQQPSLFSRPSA